MNRRPEMIGLSRNDFAERLQRPGLILQTKLPQSSHIIAMRLVPFLQIVVEYQKVRQRHGEIIDFCFVA